MTRSFERELKSACEAIIADARGGRATSAGAAWLLENYWFLRMQVREARESMPRSYFRRLPRDEKGGEPRIERAAAQLIAQGPEHLDEETLRRFFENWQEQTVLTLAELWAIRPMLKSVLLQRLAAVVAEGRLESGDAESVVRSVIGGLRDLDDVTWPELVESLSHLDRTLRNDPANAYAQMDFETRDRYRREIEEFARHSSASENEIAAAAIELARAAGRHVGFYLFGANLNELRKKLGIGRGFSTAIRDAVLAVPSLVYLGGAALATAAILWAVDGVAGPLPWWFLGLLAIPASQSALAVVNLLVSHFLKPRVQVRMDFRAGVPDDYRTLVVVPTLLLSRSSIERLIGNLEIYYLANRDRNIYFGLLTDLPDSELPGTTAEEREIIDDCVAGIRELNRRHGAAGHNPFVLFHRDREWNEAERRWMGAERKRGKLDMLNHFLIGEGAQFPLTIGDIAELHATRYVLTLDSDTQLPRDTAWKLIGSMAHPLNQPAFDERTGIVTSGYALMQPRIGISMESAGKSRLAAIYSGETGFDPYTTAVSDVYQDLFGRATFTGKGIYDVRAFDHATKGRFPDNTLLSHDLIEGEHVRAGLATDLELIDDYPSRYQTFSKRKHRWVRGDWQIAMWLLPRVPDSAWRWIKSPLPLVSRWKIFDNLRRSLVEICYLSALLAAWFLLGQESQAVTLAVIGVLLLPAYAEVVISFLRLPPLRFFRPWIWTRFSDFLRAHLDSALVLVFLPTQALLMIDAIARTIYRRVVSHQNLLQWESMAQVELAKGCGFDRNALLDPRRWPAIIKSWNLPERCLAIGVAGAFVVWCAVVLSGNGAHAAAFALLLAWMAAPLAMAWLNGGARRNAPVGDQDFLRELALATWRYFDEGERVDENWLVPDNIQLDPPARAQRTSPTNLGLQLNAYVAAHELGYITQQEFTGRVARMRSVVTSLQRERGHFFNWYNTQDLKPLGDRFVSTVDSGNLAASLVVVRQACLAIEDQPLIGPRVIDALRDHLRRIREALPVSARTTSIVRLLDGLRRQLEADPDDLFFFEGVLMEVQVLAAELQREAQPAATRVAWRAPDTAAEIRHAIEAFRKRADRMLSDLVQLAPWLGEPFETELRMSLSNPVLANLMHLVRAVPKLAELPHTYHAIEAEIHRLTETEPGLHAATLQMLAVLRTALAEPSKRVRALSNELQSIADWAERTGAEMDFRFLFDTRRNLFRIGWNADTGELAPSSYDLLASEARIGIFLAIARGQAPGQAWFHLGRKLTYYRGHRTLISWSGTMFEYLMPLLFMQTWAGTLLGESMQSVVRIQRMYARERRIPWGISESAHADRDGVLNYQYRAFGVPSCGLDRISPEDLVVAPYASVLALQIDPRAAVENLKYMEARGWRGAFGFYEAIDFRRRSRGHRHAEVIRAFMAHHQGMSLLALTNVLCENAIQKLFHSHPAVLATELLLQERMPVMAEATAPEEQLPTLEALSAEAPAGGEIVPA
jgi:hypothetical protein